MKEKPILTNKDEYPNDDILSEVLKDNFKLYNNLITTITNEPYNLTYEWRYYKDGHAWLCKIVDKKKTIIWLTVLDGYFKIAFYFSAKVSEGISKLSIDENIKLEFNKRDFIGKIKPLEIEILDDRKIEDILKIVHFKKNN